ncbi:hypothetical protein LTR70_008718 [Exophiala xenobiotica]|uniref:DUF6604 domain-containing protein n=1 Tax=Lithohypha guttulata TaxID=1690604 RepID=A0ABR0JZZ7_9EURO|nr:hypothetical protein LTR24_008413 [Lithohypha guttulata]KAK5311551.1 hypothetical protein LTR70_008718 [Exophiala xenobiotica]
MQLPSHLLRTYRRYKTEVKDLLSWICDSAEKVGHSIAPQHNTTSVKLKGRERAEARRAPEARKNVTDNDYYEEPTIAIFDIIHSVRAIASSPTITSGPADVAKKLLHVLTLRRRCLHWYRSNTSQHDRATRLENEKHEHPVSILEQEVDILRHKLPRPVLASPVRLSPAPTPAGIAFNPPIQDAKHVDVSHALGSDESDKSDTILTSLSDDGEAELDHKLPTAGDVAVGIPEALPTPRLSEDDRIQEDYNLAQFCLYQDIEQIEDYLFLELVRYALDQQNSDWLPLLANTAIDMVLKMYRSIDTLLKDPKKCRIGFLKHMVESNPDAFNKLPLMRMQDTIAKQVAISEAQKEAAKAYQVVVVERRYPEFHREGRDLDYFGTTVEQQKLVEQSFVAAIWDAEIPSEPSGVQPWFMDSVSKVIQRAKNYKPRGGYVFFSVDVATAFTLRLNLLATMVLGEKRSIAFDAHRKTALAESAQSKKWDKFKHTLAPDGRIKDISPNLVESLAHLSKDKQRYLEMLNNDLQFLAQLNPFFCCLNNHHVRMHTAVESVQITDQGFVVQLLGHVWNLLREEQYLTSGWLDLDFLIGALGVDFVFQGKRPTIAAGREALGYRIWYAFGLKKKVVAKLVSLFFSKKRPMGEICIKRHMRSRFISSDVPVFWVLYCREHWDTSEYDLGAVDAVLVTAAVVIPPILGQKPVEVVFSDRKGSISNRPQLWKQFDKGPKLDAPDPLSLMKSGLRRDFSMLDFDYLKFHKRCRELVNKLVDAFGEFESSPFHLYDKPTTADKAKYIVWDLLLSDKKEMHVKAAQVFEEWLQEDGDVGVAGIPEKPRSTSFPLPLKPQIVQVVQDIVRRRGLMDGVFTREQEWGMGVAVTGSIEQTVRTAWATQKTGKKA